MADITPYWDRLFSLAREYDADANIREQESLDVMKIGIAVRRAELAGVFRNIAEHKNKNIDGCPLNKCGCIGHDLGCGCECHGNPKL